jgi:Cu-Zn family superoxide dismutase
VVVTVTAAGLPPGVHALHLHQTGKCEPPFGSAGGHFNPLGKKHGLLNAEGPHAGDLPNVHVGADGRLEVELFAPGVALAGGPNALFDDDGAALVLHQNADDYTADPAGNAGPRIVCGVIVR